MPEHSVLVTRVALGAMIGVLVGLGGFVLLPLLMDDVDPMLRWGVLFWYPTLGATVAAASALFRAGRLLLPWSLTGALIGGWLNLVLTFFAHELMRRFIETVFGPESAFTSPFWFVLEGAVIGGIIGEVIGRFSGDDGALGPD